MPLSQSNIHTIPNPLIIKPKNTPPGSKFVPSFFEREAESQIKFRLSDAH